MLVFTGTTLEPNSMSPNSLETTRKRKPKKGREGEQKRTLNLALIIFVLPTLETDSKRQTHSRHTVSDSNKHDSTVAAAKSGFNRDYQGQFYIEIRVSVVFSRYLFNVI